MRLTQNVEAACLDNDESLQLPTEYIVAEDAHDTRLAKSADDLISNRSPTRCAYMIVISISLTLCASYHRSLSRGRCSPSSEA
jgi:hypothetical protein